MAPQASPPDEEQIAVSFQEMTFSDQEYIPWPHQKAFHCSPAKFRLQVGGFGSGKSRPLLYEAIFHALEYPGSNSVILRKTMPDLKRTVEFDISSGLWHERESWDSNNNSLGQWRGSCAIAAYDDVLIGDAFSGLIGMIDWTTYTEYGNTIRGLGYSAPLHHDRKRVFCSRLELDIQAGVGLTTGYGSNPQIMLAVSVDGANTWRTLQPWRSMGKVGNYLQRLRWLRQGMGRQLVFQITLTDPTPRVIIAAHADISIGM